MKVIIFAGGTGKRFWPASKKTSPKQFQPIVEDKPLIQVKYDYLRLGFNAEDIFVSTGEQYKEEARAILPEIPERNFIFEPEMRDTGPAVAYAIAYVDKLYPGEVISLQWSDHLIKKPEIFIHALKEGEKVFKNENKTVIIGTPPRFPSPHRGYIKYGHKIKNLDGGNRVTLCEFIRFVEKPTQEVATEYLRSGDYSWNPGYFITNKSKVMDKYQTFAPDIYNFVQSAAENNFTPESIANYSELEKTSFDYIFAENLNPEDAMVINVEMGWSDVGEWLALKEALEEAPEANVTSGLVHDLDSEDSIVYNFESSKLVATIGLKGMVVVNTPDAVAIFPKDENHRLKEFLSQLEKKYGDKYL